MQCLDDKTMQCCERIPNHIRRNGNGNERNYQALTAHLDTEHSILLLGQQLPSHAGIWIVQLELSKLHVSICLHEIHSSVVAEKLWLAGRAHHYLTGQCVE
ncbi:hypothetical protein AAC387_Pa07g0465 [Persea americana]